MHRRTLIRRAIVERLRAAFEGLRVAPAQTKDFEVGEAKRDPVGRSLPFTAWVFTDSERATEASTQNPNLDDVERSLMVEVVVGVKHSDGEILDEITDSTCEIVERELTRAPLKDPSGDLLISGCYYVETLKAIDSDKGEFFETAKLTFEARYSYAPETDQNLDDFLRAFVEYNLGAAQDTADRAKDQINLPGPSTE